MIENIALSLVIAAALMGLWVELGGPGTKR